jgi:2-keto-4-pentenoate hydratase/2-oxohepta-3-ene-1,7-dioic acid hydratase in catechol pathway
MRLARFAHEGTIQVGRVDGDAITVLGTGDSVLDIADRDADGRTVALADVQLLAPIARPPKFLAIGLNYADHVTESGGKAPEFPLFFNKQTSCVTGPHDPIFVPPESSMVDYEGELGIVIGTRCRRVTKADAPSVVAGYIVINDVSVRDWQFRSATMTLGKSWDSHGPIGPWLVTGDEVGDPHGLRLRTWVSGELLQDGNTGDMVYDCWSQIEVLSTVCTLEPGDIIATGTPAGVGIARKPPRMLVHGDTVRIEIERIGTIENPVVAEPF